MRDVVLPERIKLILDRERRLSGAFAGAVAVAVVTGLIEGLSHFVWSHFVDVSQDQHRPIRFGQLLYGCRNQGCGFRTLDRLVGALAPVDGFTHLMTILGEVRQ